MKKVLAIIVVTIIHAASCFAQKDVTRFLGIPVDGSKSEMIHKLKDKGFSTHPLYGDVLQGEFNGMDVNVHIGTNGNKVYRIMLCDERCVNERSIQIRFNNLCYQFENNSKYLSLDVCKIPDDEDISYEMAVNSKRYSAIFCQKVTEFPDTAVVQERIKSFMLSKYTPEQLDKPTDEMQTEIQNMMIKWYMELCMKKKVWFMISEYGGEYYIIMYYDNEYNMANGEDL